MKRALYKLSFVLLLIPILFSCKKEYTAPKPLNFYQLNTPTEEYLANLRTYKKSDHQVCFGWFTGYAAGNDPAMNGRLETLPDSMDIVSFFEGFFNVPQMGSSAQTVMQDLQKNKGTRFVIGIFSSNIDALRIKNFPTLPVLEGIDSVAKSLADSISRYHLDGVDVDYEPSYGDGGIFGHGDGGTDAGGDVYTQKLFLALSRYLGPLSATGKILMIDGENEPGIASQIDYLAQQAYGASSDASLENRFYQFGFDVLPISKFIAADWTQATTKDYGGLGILGFYGFAAWDPEEGRKAGAGMYGSQDNYDATDPYRILRNMIQIMNPAAK